MPYLQLDVNDSYPVDIKKTLAKKMANIYADLMTVDIRRISIAVREVGQGGVWRTVDGEPVPVSVLMCDIRNSGGRPNCGWRSLRPSAPLASKYLACAKIG